MMFNNDEIIKQVKVRQSAGQTVVFTNGCFDVLHVGHLRYLMEARALGDLLVVGINSDASVRRLKGPERPINQESDRREMLLALKVVDLVAVFEEDTPLALIEKISPQVLVKGGDWPEDKIVGAEHVKKSGGRVLSLPFVNGYSTTSIVNKIRNNN